MSKTLAAIIAAHEAHQGARTVLTPLGQTTATVRHLKHEIAALDAGERAILREELTALVAELDDAAWTAFDAALNA